MEKKFCIIICFALDVNSKVPPIDGAIPFTTYMAKGQEAKQSSPSGKFSQQSWGNSNILVPSFTYIASKNGHAWYWTASFANQDDCVYAGSWNVLRCQLIISHFHCIRLPRWKVVVNSRSGWSVLRIISGFAARIVMEVWRS